MQSTESDLKHTAMIKPILTSFGYLIGRLAATIVATFICTSVFAQGFEIAFGGPKEDRGEDILQTIDHGYLQVGITEGELGDDNDIDIFVVRTDVDGTPIWVQTYDEGFEEFPTEVIPANDEGNFIISGFRQDSVGFPTQAYLLKINELGEVIWSRTYPTDEDSEQANHIIAIPDGGYLLTGTITDANTDRQDILLRKVDEEGLEIWQKRFGGERDQEGIGAIVSPAGFIIGAKAKSIAQFDNDIHLYGVNTVGDSLWRKVYGSPSIGEQLEDIIPTSDGNLVMVGSVDNFNAAFVAKADLNGDTLWYTEINSVPFEDELFGVIEEEGNFVATGYASPNVVELDILLVKVNGADGQLIFRRLIGDDGVDNVARDLVPDVKGGYAIGAYNSIVLDQFNDMTIYQTDTAGVHLTNQIRGRVFHSTDGCNPYTPGDKGLESWLVRAESENAVFFGSTDSLGFYDLQVDVGDYTVSLLQKNDRWEICNPVAFIIDFTEPYDSTEFDFPLTPAFDCPLLDIELSAGPAIACEIQTLTVSYGNQGTITAEDPSITIELDEFLGYSSSSIPPSSQDGQTLTFDLPDLPAGERGTFTINAAVACDGLENQQALSTAADILPIYDCYPVDPDWNGSSIEISSECTDTAVVFTITNVGENPLDETLNFVVVEDIILYLEGDFNNIPAGDFERVIIPFDEIDGGATYRIIAEQPEGHPGELFPTAVVEGCTEDGSNNYTTGRVAQFADNDGDLNIDILTQEVFVLDTSVNPANLRAYPKGYQDSIITPITDLEYTILFTLDSDEDTIGRVVIRDTLSALLDLNSLELGAASHPYDFTLYQNGVLRITFDSIQLHAGGGTGGAGNPPRQQGYVTFRLSQKPNNAIGEIISNRAAVYFDYRTPMVTNRVNHIIGCQDIFDNNCLLTNDVNYPTFPGVTISISPNPMTTFTTVYVEGWERDNTEFEYILFDAQGRPVFQTTTASAQIQVPRRNLPSASYYYEVKGDGLLIGRGKLFVQ